MLDFVAQMIAGTLFGRIEEARIGEQPLRRRLLSIIHERPGIHASELCRTAGEPWGTVQYHLSLLGKTDMVTAIEAGRERRFFPQEVDPGRARLLAVLHQGRRQEVATFIRDHPGTRQVDVCDAVNVSRKTFRASIEPLLEQGLVHERRGLQSNRYFPQEGLAELLVDVEASHLGAGAQLGQPPSLEPGAPL
jgi:predicted transcriptional regulator